MFNLKNNKIMKKFTYVFVLMIAMVLMNTNCTKSTDDPLDSTNPSTGLITLTDLNGTWNTTSYVLNGKIYTTSTQILADPAVNNKLSMLLTFVVTGSTCNVIDKSTGTNKETDGFNIFLNAKGDEITIGDDAEYVFYNSKL